MRPPASRFLAPALAASLLTAAAAYAQSQPPASDAWRGCCGLPPWAEAGPMTRPGGEGTGLLFRGYRALVPGSTVRHNVGLRGGIPEPYARLHNPLPPTPENARAGASVYAAQCASCHGESGKGDGPAAQKLNPPPAQFGWLAKVPASRRDAFMYWSIAEGGARFGTAMPSFKGRLSDAQIWSVVGYIQARLPSANAAR